MKIRSIEVLIATLLSLILSNCALVIDDEPEEYAGHIYYWPPSSSYDFIECQDSYSLAYCGSHPQRTGQDYSWQPNCSGEDCQSVGLFVHYQLFQDLGSHTSLWIEVFDNPQYAGRAASLMRITNFDASYPHSSDMEEIFLKPGEYYLRAFISTKNDTPLPPELQGLEPASGAFGIYGALSSPERIIIKPYGVNPPIHIYVDQLYKDPQQEVDTQAQFRIKMTVPPDLAIPSNRSTIVQISTEQDIEHVPNYRLVTSSNDFLIIDSPRLAEIKSKNLAIDSYYVFAFIDEDGNEFYDEGELAGYYTKGMEPWPILAKKNTVQTLSLKLKAAPFGE